MSRSERFILLTTGRRCGKTIGILNLLAKRSIIPNQKLWYVAPTRSDAKELAWTELLRIYSRLAPETNLTDLTIALRNGTKITLVSAENIQARRGRGLDGVAIDEWTMIDSAAWDEVISPSLADRRGWALFAGTPTGKTSAAYKFLLDSQGQADFHCMSYTTLEGGLVLPEEIEAQRRRLHPRKFRQEFEASWESPTAQILDAIADKHRIPRDNLPAFDECVMGIDWGDVNPCITVCGKITRRDGNTAWWLVDSWHNPNSDSGIAVRDDELLAQAKRMWGEWKCRVGYADPSRPASLDLFNRGGLKIKKAVNAWNEGASAVNAAFYHDRLWVIDDLTQCWDELCGWHRASDRAGNILDAEAPNQRAETPDCLRYTILSHARSSDWWRKVI